MPAGVAPLRGGARAAGEALKACGGNQTRAAQQLGISRGTLLSRLKQYGITRPRS